MYICTLIIEQKMNRVRGIIYGVVSAITFGLIPLFAVPIQKAGHLDTVSIIFYRFLFGAIIMGIIALLAGKSFKVKRKELGALALFGLNYAVTALGLLYSYNMIPSGIATTIHALYPVTVTLFAVFFFREKVSYKLIIAILGSFVGVFMMCWSGDVENMWGVALVLLTVITYTGYILLMSKSSIKKLNPMSLNFYVMAFCTVFVFALTPFTEIKEIAPITTQSDWINLILLALIATVISNIMLIMGVKTAGATRTAIMGSFEPSTAILVGVLYFGESIDLTGVLGFFLIIISTIVVIINSQKKSSQ